MPKATLKVLGSNTWCGSIDGNSKMDLSGDEKDDSLTIPSLTGEVTLVNQWCIYNSACTLLSIIPVSSTFWNMGLHGHVYPWVNTWYILDCTYENTDILTSDLRSHRWGENNRITTVYYLLGHWGCWHVSNTMGKRHLPKIEPFNYVSVPVILTECSLVLKQEVSISTSSDFSVGQSRERQPRSPLKV